MRNLLLTIVLVLTLASLTAETVDFSTTLNTLPINRSGNPASDANFIMAETGEPMLPFESYNLMIPYGTSVDDIVVELTDYTELRGEWQIPHNQAPSSTGAPVFDTQRDQAIYSSDDAYPSYNYELVTVQRLAGMDIAVINVYPYKYMPASGRVGYYRNIDIHIDTKDNNTVREEQNRKICKSESIMKRLNILTVNPELVQSYPNENTPELNRDLVDVNDPYQYVIVCGADYVDLFEDYAEWKEEHGVHAGVFSINDIYSEYSGTQTIKLRSFIADAYETWANTAHPLEYVLLAGDDEIIPVRGVWGYVNETDNNIPCDMYYGCLDGTWNADGDAVYGESNDNVDLYAEVHVGRYPGDTMEDFENMIFKTIQYVDYPASSIDKCTLVGEQLDDTPTYGGDYKDEVGDSQQMLPSYYNVTTLYERDGTFTASDFMDHVNADNGGLMNHMGHCDYNIAMGMTPAMTQNLSNTEYPFVYSQGCYALAFDQETSGDVECIGEHMLFNEHGWFAFVGNTRYGWYAHGSTNGASQQFDKKYFLSLFYHDIREMAVALTNSKELNVAYVNTGGGTYRWVYYEMVLFGDPEVAIYNGEGNMPDLDIFFQQVSEYNGDGDGVLNPGEQASVALMLINNPGTGAAQNSSATLVSDSPYIEVIDGYREFGTLGPGATSDNNDDPFIIQLSEDCPTGENEFLVELTANVGSTTYFVKQYVLLATTLLYYPNFPYTTDSSVYASPIVVDINNDGNEEIISADTSGNIFALNKYSANISGFPVATGSNIRTSLAMGNLDNDPQLEIAAVSYDRKITIVDNDGSIRYQGEVDQLFMGSPTIADFAGDSREEVICGNMNNNIYVKDADGNDIENFPLAMPNRILGGIAVGDVDSDGDNELAVGCFDGNLYIVEADGTYETVTLGGQITNTPVIYGDGKVAVSSSNFHLFVVEGDSVIHDITLPAKISKSVIAVDFDNDDDHELAFSLENGDTYIMEDDGTVFDGWPIDLGAGIDGAPVAGDIDGDQIMDLIVINSEGVIHGLNVSGENLSNFPIGYGIPTQSSVSLCNIDGNGSAELAAGTNTGVSIWDLKTNSGLLSGWPFLYGDIGRTACTQTIVANDPQTAPSAATALIGNYPNPFNPETTFSFSISDADSKQPVSLKIYNIKGQLVKTIANEKMAAGEHNLTWRGTSDTGTSVASGIYFYRLSTASKSHIRKMLLLK